MVDSDQPDVVPLQVSGSIDTESTTLPAEELSKWATANLWRKGKEGRYAIRHSRDPVSDFGRPRQGDPEFDNPERENFFAKAFPCLFPYGVGGVESDQPKTLSFTEHIRWTLEYFDRRFRRHDTFPYVAFGIEQRRQVLGSARLQMRRKNFEKEARLLSTITVEKLERASREEKKNEPISDPAIRLLKQHVHATGGRVVGTDQSRYRLRSQIWSTAMYLGPPSAWITINPTDLHDPIAQVFCGEQIDLDNFVRTAGPDAERRAQNIADDPYGAAKYFHFVIKAVLETLLQIRKSARGRVRSGVGVLGEIAAYFAAIEQQGRASLHLHMLLYYKHAPNAEEMEQLLKSEEFRERVVAYIRANFRTYLPGLGSEKDVEAIPNEVEIAYSRPLSPDESDYDAKIADFELRLARAKQVHTCYPRQCLIYKQGVLQCKRGAPFDTHENDFVEENGRWGSKRLYGYMNGWIPSILVNMRCNGDGKLLTNGEETKNYSFYITNYAAKKQGSTLR